MSPKSREQLFDIIFEQWGAMSLYGQIGKLKNLYYKIKMSSDKVYNKELLYEQHNSYNYERKNRWVIEE